MTATQWLLLDNLRMGWPYWTNLARKTADEEMDWAAENKYVLYGRITPEGSAALVISNATGDWKA